MANIHDKVSEQTQPAGGGMRRVLADGSESLGELREFMQRLRGKSPGEVLGEVANSSLVRSTLWSAAGFAVVLLSLSIAAYYWKLAFPPQAPQASATTAPAAETAGAPTDASPASSAPGAEATGPGTAAQAASADSTQSGDPTLDTLGIGETKQADAAKNPLEDSLDNLLDGAK